MTLIGHRQRLLAAAAVTLALVHVVDGWAGRALAQELQLRGSVDGPDTSLDAVDGPAGDAASQGERLTSLGTGPIDDTPEEEPPRLVRDERGRLVPSQPGGPIPIVRPPQQRAQPAIAVSTVGTPLGDGSSVARSNLAARPVQGGAPGSAQPGPYDPLGVRVGPLRVTTSVEQALGVTSNAEFANEGEGSAFSETRVDIEAVSDMALHELRGSLRGSYRKFFEDVEDLPTLDAEASFRYDVRQDTNVTFGANWSVASESATDDSLLGLTRTVRARPLVQQGAASVTAERRGGRLFGLLRGSIGREQYADIEFTDGSRLDQDDRDATIFETALRLGYAHTPAFQPFIEGEIGYRLHDEREDRNGQNRDALRYALRVGAEIDLNEKVTGSLSAGLEGVSYESRRLDTVLGPSIEGRLDWSPDRLTRLGVVAQTLFDDSVTAGVGGTLDYRLALEANHDLRENLALFGTLTLGLADPGGPAEETTYAAEAGVTWSINRALALTGRVAYSRLDSTLADADYEVKSASIGLRWQN